MCHTLQGNCENVADGKWHAAFQNDILNLLPRKVVSLTGGFLRWIANGDIASSCSDPCFWNALQIVLIVYVIFDSPDFHILQFETKGSISNYFIVFKQSHLNSICQSQQEV